MLADLFRRREALAPRKKPPRHTLAVEERRWGARFPAELADLLRLGERHLLKDLSDFRPFFFDDPFFPEGHDAALKLVRAGRKMHWPVYYRAHFWGVYCFAATNGADYYLASLEPAPRSRVFLYDHEEHELRREASSIAELVWRASSHNDENDDDDDAPPAPRALAARPASRAPSGTRSRSRRAIRG
jgi:hypothetical protein